MGLLTRAIDKFGATIDFLVSEHRDEAAATSMLPALFFVP
jgi:transposase-like protein